MNLAGVGHRSILSVLFGLYLVAAVSSQSLLDTVTMLIIGLSLYWLARDRQKIIMQKIGIEWALIGYFAVVVLGFIVNAAPDAGWRRALLKFSWLFLLYFLILAFQLIKIVPVWLVQFVSSLSLLPTVYSLISYIHGVDLLTGRDNSRLTGLVNSSTYHAHGNAVIFVFLAGGLYFCYQELTTKWRAFVLTSTFLLGVSIFLTFTRGIWISLFVSTCLVFFFLDRKKLIKIVSLGALIFILFLSTWSKFKDRIENSSSAASNQQRVDLFHVNVEIWQEYPWLGIGYGENQRRNREYWDRPEWHKPAGYIVSHAHNQFLNVLSTTGVFGFFFFCSFYFYFIRKNFKLIRLTSRTQTPHKYAVLVVCLWAQVEFFLGCLSDVSFEYAKIRALLVLIWALVVAIDWKPDLVQEIKS